MNCPAISVLLKGLSKCKMTKTEKVFRDWKGICQCDTFRTAQEMSLLAFAELSSGNTPLYQLQEVGQCHHETNYFSHRKAKEIVHLFYDCQSCNNQQ